MFMISIWRDKYTIIMQPDSRKNNYLTIKPTLNTNRIILL